MEKEALLQPEELKSFGSKGHAARGAQQPQLVVPFPYPLIKLHLDFIQMW